MTTEGKIKVLCGSCPDGQCQARLFFPSYDTSIECTSCGQRHERRFLKNVQEVSNPGVALHNMIKNILVSNVIPKRGAEMVKVLGLSNYHCKLLSPLLTHYGMEKKSGKAVLLREMNQGDMFDCSLLGDRAFLLDPEHILVVGYGRDVSGSMSYLSGTLEQIKMYNDGEERLIPIHADGDGHCLVHAVSRALVGRELFWHPLRCNLKTHFEQNLDKYKKLFRDFIADQEWRAIIDECDPDFIPPENELLGLRNIHIFGLANVLKRPIILLDSLAGMQSLGDYAALFLPAMVSPEECCSKDGVLHKPLCLAWSSHGHNHYIALVGVRKRSLPRLPRSLVPKVWGVPQGLIDKYVKFDDNNCCILGGDHTLGDSYVLRLAKAMEEVFWKKYGVHPELITDVHQYVYHRTGIVGVKPQMVVQATQKSIQEQRLYRCLTCDAICEVIVMPEWLKPGGTLYKTATQNHGQLQQDKLYSFPMQGVICRYDVSRDELIPDFSREALEKCTWCQGTQMRLVNGDGAARYRNGDRTKTRSKSSLCNCGFKHYWDGKEYDNIPLELPVVLEWNNKVVRDTVLWFQNESDLSLNSNVYDVASAAVQKYFPGAFGSERLLQRVVDQILEQTKDQTKDQGKGPPVDGATCHMTETAQKLIIGGAGILHKEELGVSKTEQGIQQQIAEKISKHQQKFTDKVKSKRGALKWDRTASPPSQSSSSSSPTASPTERTSRETRSETTSPSGSPSKGSFVRVVTSDGKQARMQLRPEGITFIQLQTWIQEKFGVEPAQQRLKWGFPLRELKPPCEERKNSLLPLAHGDKVTVEVQPIIISEPQEITDQEGTLAVAGPSLNSSSLGSEVSKFDMLKQVKQDSLDASLISMMLTANLAGQTVWQYAQKQPHLFASGGLLYKQAERDVGLVNGKHCRLPLIPDKVFRYNSHYDQLELCLEPHGHFAISEGIEERVLGQTLRVSEASPVSSVASLPGSSGIVSTSAVPRRSAHIPFQGMGHTLRESQPTNSKVTAEREVACPKTPFTSHSVALPGATPSIIPPQTSTRKGPGFSVLDPQEVGVTRSPEDRLKEMVAKIKSADHPSEEDNLKRLECLEEDTEMEETSTESNIHHPDNRRSGQDPLKTENDETLCQNMDTDDK
ncbi:deubiquitinating protein VCPIP1-like [Tachypleus tridentatus]|uniref:deubiquitinating protein VCPIP1-like n=1 Tax=Tachypleus tridentatus TaxID=6853 RepID=UPI003FD6475D